MPYKSRDEANKKRRERYANDPEFRARLRTSTYAWKENNLEKSNSYTAQWQRESRKKDPDKFRKYELRKKFKVSLEWYEEQLAKQNGVCAICKKPEIEIHHQSNKVQWLAVDHDHSCCPGDRSCGRCLRGLLCAKCNRTLHRAEEIPFWLYYVSDYLTLYKK